MARTITVALVQMDPALADPESNLIKMGEFVERICSEQQTHLVVFPELAYTGNELGLRAVDLAERCWDIFELSFTATSSSTRIRVQNTYTSNSGGGPVIDPLTWSVCTSDVDANGVVGTKLIGAN